MSNIFRGLGVALITPFKSDMSIDFEALERLVNYQLDNGADFLCILATTGETPCLTRSEKDEITRVVKSVVKGRVPLLKYCGGNNTRAVIEEMKSSDWEGIDGILSICPYYNKPSQEGLYQHFKAIAEAHGLTCVPCGQYGWNTVPGDNLVEYALSKKWNEIQIGRSSLPPLIRTGAGGAAQPGAETTPGGKRPSSTRKLICPKCGQSVRATKKVNILCGDCMLPMVET